MEHLPSNKQLQVHASAISEITTKPNREAKLIKLSMRQSVVKKHNTHQSEVKKHKRLQLKRPFRQKA